MTARDLVTTWFDQDVVPRLVVGDDLVVLECNAAAREAIARHPLLALDRERLVARDAKLNRELQAFVVETEAKPRSFVLKAEDRPGTLVRSQRIESAGRTLFALTLGALTSPDETQESSLAEHFLLTRTEDRILHFLLEGMTSRQIAERQGCAHETARSHVRNIYRKLSVGTRMDLLKLARTFSLGA